MMTEAEATEPQTDEEPKPVGLTVLDLKALREANRVAFDHNQDGTGGIRAIKELTEPWERERTYEIRTESTVRSYRDGHSSNDRYRCFSLEHSGQHSPRWRTIVSLLRRGDVLALRWSEDAGTCPALEERGMHGDCLDLEVKRGDKTLTFYIDDRVGPDNTARMVRWVG